MANVICRKYHKIRESRDEVREYNYKVRKYHDEIVNIVYFHMLKELKKINMSFKNKVHKEVPFFNFGGQETYKADILIELNKGIDFILEIKTARFYRACQHKANKQLGECIKVYKRDPKDFSFCIVKPISYCKKKATKINDLENLLLFPTTNTNILPYYINDILPIKPIPSLLI